MFFNSRQLKVLAPKQPSVDVETDVSAAFRRSEGRRRVCVGMRKHKYGAGARFVEGFNGSV